MNEGIFKMSFHSNFYCMPCYLLDNIYTTYYEGQIITWRRLVCGNCIEKCCQEGWRRGSLPDSFLTMEQLMATNTECSICSESRALLFHSIVCDNHVGLFNKDAAEDTEVADSDEDTEVENSDEDT